MNTYPKRKNHRLREYDYSSYGYYFVTICTHSKIKVLSRVVDGKTELTNLGLSVKECWENIAKLNNNVELGSFVIMPNHIHGIIILRNQGSYLTQGEYSFQIAEESFRRSLKGLIKDFKSVTTRIFKRKYNKDHSLWQSSFFDEIIKSEKHYLSAMKYIELNPLKWELDKYYL